MKKIQLDFEKNSLLLKQSDMLNLAFKKLSEVVFCSLVRYIENLFNNIGTHRTYKIDGYGSPVCNLHNLLVIRRENLFYYRHKWLK